MHISVQNSYLTPCIFVRLAYSNSLVVLDSSLVTDHNPRQLVNSVFIFLLLSFFLFQKFCFYFKTRIWYVLWIIRLRAAAKISQVVFYCVYMLRVICRFPRKSSSVLRPFASMYFTRNNW